MVPSNDSCIRVLQRVFSQLIIDHNIYDTNNNSTVNFNARIRNIIYSIMLANKKSSNQNLKASNTIKIGWR